MGFITRFYRERKYWDLILASVGLLVATLSKLPFLMFSISSIYFFLLRFTNEKWFVKHGGFYNDVLEYQVVLKNLIPKDELCIILNERSQNYFSYKIDKMGHIFYNDELPVDWIGDMIDNSGVTHLYSDSRVLDEDPDFDQFVDSLLLAAGRIKVFKLSAAASDTIKFLPDFKRMPVKRD